MDCTHTNYNDRYFLILDVSVWDFRLEFDLFFVCILLLFVSGLIQKFFPLSMEKLDYQEFHQAIKRSYQIMKGIKEKKEVTANVNSDLIANFRIAKENLEKNRRKEEEREYSYILTLIDQLTIIIRFLEDRFQDQRFYLVEYGIEFRETYPTSVEKFNKAIKFLNNEFREEINECIWIYNFA